MTVGKQKFITNKARNLQKLCELGFTVPKFHVVTREEINELLSNLDSFNPLILRSCVLNEDSHFQSLAGQAKTIGPINSADIHAVLKSLFDDPRVVEVIVQDFIDDPSGVLFCTSHTEGLFEYSRIPETVTGGRGRPFVAIFPNEIPRYEPVREILAKLFDSFGPCDVELTLGTAVHVLQVRPLTAAFSIGRELETQMYLQELPFDSLIQDEFCSDLAESPEFDDSLIREYCNCRKEIIKLLATSAEIGSPGHFVKIGRQIFVNRKIGIGIALDRIAHYRLAHWSTGIILRKWLRRKQLNLTGHELMQCAIALRTFAEMNDKLPEKLSQLMRRRLLRSRDICRKLLRLKLAERTLPPYISEAPRLKSPLQKDDSLLMWKTFALEDREGQIVVPGDFNSGPYLLWNDGMQFPSAKVILICRELYPEIFTHFPHLRGIICEGGALTSHLAILARESQMPLWIQVSDALTRFMPNTKGV